MKGAAALRPALGVLTPRAGFYLFAAVRLLLRLALGLFGLAALAACVLGWRLAQGPLDMAWLLHRAQSFLGPTAAKLHIGRASLAWEGFDARDQPLEITLRDISFDLADGGPLLRVGRARLGLSVGQVLRGHPMPGSVEAQGVAIMLQRRADGSLALPGTAIGQGSGTGWPPGLGHVHLRDSSVVVRDAGTGIDWQARHLALDLDADAAGGFSGTARTDLQAGAMQTTLALQAVPQAGGTVVKASLAAINPATLARLSPALAKLGALDALVGLDGSVDLGAELSPGYARLVVTVGPGTLAAGTGSIGLAQATATISGSLAELHLDAVRVSFARLPSLAPPPVITAQATATRGIGGQVHLAFAVGIDGVAMADLGRYWPAGMGGGTRPWLVANVTAGRAHDAHVAGTLDLPADFSDAVVDSLSGGLSIDDATVWWLRPVPPLVHVAARVVVEGPDALRVMFDRGSQDRQALSPGSSIHVTGLMARHQFGDIAAGLTGPLDDALALLNHPRLKLLSRGNVDVVDPAGSVAAKLTLHIPLEDRVTMDDIPIAATAALTGVHLGRVVGGRDLDQADLALKVTGHGLDISGNGRVAGIPADLALQMDFDAGPPGEILQHLVASGRATAAQLRGAGAPASIGDFLTGGDVGLRVDYAGHRNGTAAIQVDADLRQATLATPVAWSKPAGQPAAAGARVLLDHGRLAGMEHVHAEAPGLAIASRAEFSPGGSRALILDRLELGGTKAAGRVDFPAAPQMPLTVRLSGPMLDFSAYLDARASPTPAPANPPPAAEDDDSPGAPWSVNLEFNHLQLARREVLSPFSLMAASDGSRILHADASAGESGDFAAHILPDGGGRNLSLLAGDAGAVLRAAGVADNLRGGSLKLDGFYDDSQPGSPLTGTATLQKFQLTDAPGIGRLLQAMTLYGMVDALRGPGLRFSKLVAPFRWHRRVLTLSSARAFSPSLGLTAQGDIDLHRRIANVTGTVVPAYFFNQLLGNLPLIGRVFSPEKGGGVFAARYSVRGPLANPKVGVNPLAALTPGFLREGFGLFAPVPK